MARIQRRKFHLSIPLPQTMISTRILSLLRQAMGGTTAWPRPDGRRTPGTGSCGSSAPSRNRLRRLRQAPGAGHASPDTRGERHSRRSTRLSVSSPARRLRLNNSNLGLFSRHINRDRLRAVKHLVLCRIEKRPPRLTVVAIDPSPLGPHPLKALTSDKQARQDP